MKTTYYCAMSSDHFIATKDGGVSWLDELDMDESESTYEAFFSSVGGLAMGRGTYDFVFNYGSWPYGDIPTWVFTSKPLEPLEGANLHCVKTIDAYLQETQAKNIQHIWLVGGGQLASTFLKRGLLTHLSITEAPIKLETGIPLFSEHSLATIEVESAQTEQKSGYRQLEMTLAKQHPHSQ